MTFGESPSETDEDIEREQATRVVLVDVRIPFRSVLALMVKSTLAGTLIAFVIGVMWGVLLIMRGEL